MLLNQEDIDEFKQIYKAEFGEDLTEGEARVMATRLLALYEALARPLPSERENREQSSS